MYEDIDLGAEAVRNSFLGLEFMTWLWYRVETENNQFDVKTNQFEVTFDDQLVLEVQLAESEQTRLKGGAPAHSPEAYKALQHGKRIARARVRIAQNERAWLFMVSSESFAMSGLKIPAVLKDDEDDKIDERLYLIDELDTIWSTIYGEFLRVRLSDGWEKEADTIRQWIKDLRDSA